MSGRKLVQLSILFGASISFCLAEITIYVPHVVSGRDPYRPGIRSFDYITNFYFVNLSGEEIQFVLETFLEDGEPMNVFRQSGGIGKLPTYENTQEAIVRPFGAGRLDTDVVLDARFVGWARITSSGPVGIVAQIYAYEVGGDRLLATSLIPQPLANAFSASADLQLFQRTALALLNPSASEEATVRLRLFGQNGMFEDERTITIPPQWKIAEFLNASELFSDQVAFRGSVEIESSVPLAATVILVDFRAPEVSWSAFAAFPGRQIDLNATRDSP